MKRLTFVLLLVLGALLTGCAQKLPVNTGNDVGVLAIPMMGQKSGRGEFIFSYELTHSMNHEIAIRITPGAGEKFVFSEALPAGSYTFDTVTMYAKPTITTLSSVNKLSRKLDTPVRIQIEAGKVVLLPSRLRVSIKPGDAEEFYQVTSWEEMDEETIVTMKKRLESMENADGWQIQ